MKIVYNLKYVCNTIQTKFNDPITGNQLKKTLRASVAFLIAIVFTLATPTAKVLGSLNYLSPLSIILLYSDTSSTINSLGGILQSIIRYSVAILTGGLFAWVSLLSAYAVSDGPARHIIFLAYLFTAMLLFTFWRLKYPKEWAISMLIAKVIVILGIIYGYDEGTYDPSLILDLVKVLLLGTAISLFCTMVIFPQSASGNLNIEIIETLDKTISLLETSTKALFEPTPAEEEKLKKLRKETSKNFTSLSSLLNDAKIEISYGRLRTVDYIAITYSLKRLIQLEWSMISCNLPEEDLGTSEEIDNAIVKPLHESVILLCKECIDDIREMKSLVDGTSDIILVKENNRPLFDFDNKQKEIAQKLLPTEVDKSYETVFRVYFWVFSFREFVRELHSLRRHLTDIPISSSLHFPSQLLPFPKSSSSSPNPTSRTFRYQLWEFFHELGSIEFKVAFKTAITITILAMPVFTSPDVSFVQEYRLEWTIVTIAVITQTSFGNNYITGIWRIIGTITGALWSIISWYAFPSNPYGLFFMIFVFAVPFFYVVQNTPYPKLGVVSLLTLVIILCGKYSASIFETLPQDPIYELAFKRSICVIIGVIASLLVSRLVWPYLARKALRKKLSKTFSELGQIHSRIVEIFVSPEPTQDDIVQFQKLEARLQLRILRHFDLLTAAKSEPRLKGPFLSEPYEKSIRGAQFILDRLRSLRMIVLRGMGRRVKKDIIGPLNPLRKEMIRNVMLLYHLLSSSFGTKKALPHYLPNAKKSRDKVVKALLDLPVMKDGILHKKTKTKFIYFYAYALATKEIIFELEFLADQAKHLFGEVGFINGLDNRQDML